MIPIRTAHDPMSDSGDQTHVVLQGLQAIARGGTDEELADAIADAGARLRPRTLAPFLAAIPNLAARPVALDAAIEAVLRALNGSGVRSDEAAQQLAAAHPDLADEIRVAALLGRAMDGSVTLAAQLRTPKIPDLPADAGPLLNNGQKRYQLRELLGAGSQGAVFLARDRLLSDESHPAWVAAKVMPLSEPGARGTEAAAEALRARRVVHPNIVRVLDRFDEPSLGSILIYEHIQAGSMEAWRAAQAVPPTARDAARLTAAIARGVQAAHSAGVVHRDLKPANVLMADGVTPKVTDFGVAACAADLPGSDRIGSLGFCSPEQYHLEAHAASPAADVYSVGAVLFWLLTGDPANGADAEQSAANLTDIQSLANRHSSLLIAKGLDADLVAVCLRALAPDPANRYASADSLAADLEAWLDLRPIEWTRPSSVRRAKLAGRRYPIGTSVLLGAIALCIAGASVATYSLHIANLRKVENELQMERQRVIERQYLKEQFDFVTLYLRRYLDMGNKNGAGLTWLNITTFVEGVLGPRMTRTNEHGYLLWDQRIDVTREWLAKAAAEGRSDHFEPRLLETCLGFWLLQRDHYAEGIEVVRTSRERWLKFFPAEDPFIRSLDAMIACGNAGMLKASDPAGAKAQLNEAKAILDALPERPDAVRYLFELLRQELTGEPVSWER